MYSGGGAQLFVSAASVKLLSVLVSLLVNAVVVATTRQQQQYHYNLFSP